MFKIVFLLVLLSFVISNDGISMRLTKEYPNGEKILDENGNWIDNPDFDKHHHHPVNNERNLIYYGDIYFWKDGYGRPDRLQVIMDTGSSWLWAPSSICRGCPSDDSLEHSYITNKGEGVKTIKYGSGSISGDIVRATASLSDNRADAISDYKMLEVTSANLPGLQNSNWDGILGLLPSAISGSKLFVSELYKAGVISRDAFGVSYTDTSQGSQITFGAFDTDKVKEEDDFTFIDLHDNMHWSAELVHSKYGAFGMLPDDAKYAILDSGTSLMLIPPTMFDALKGFISKGRKCGHLGVYFGCYCDSKYDFDPLFFRLANYEYRVSPETYVVETWTNRRRFCYFLIQGSNIKKNAAILGDSFLRNYYVYHDVTNRRMGLYGDYMLYYRTGIFTPVFWAILITVLIMIC